MVLAAGQVAQKVAVSLTLVRRGATCDRATGCRRRPVPPACCPSGGLAACRETGSSRRGSRCSAGKGCEFRRLPFTAAYRVAMWIAANEHGDPRARSRPRQPDGRRCLVRVSARGHPRHGREIGMNRADVLSHFRGAGRRFGRVGDSPTHARKEHLAWVSALPDPLSYPSTRPPA